MAGNTGQPVPKSLRGKTCYACSAQAMSWDHVPPRFLFPEQGDLGHKYGDLRQNLIKVPACEQHNTEQTRDDTYFTIFAVTSDRNNEIALDHFDTKIQRSLDKDPQVAKWYSEAIYVDGRPRENTARLDRTRLDRCVNKIVKGLYFKLTNRKLAVSETTGIYYPDLFAADLQTLLRKQRFEKGYSKHDHQFVQYPVGSPRIFSLEYSLDAQQPHRFVFKMKFYEGFRVWVINNNPVVNTEGIRPSVQGLVRQ